MLVIDMRFTKFGFADPHGQRPARRFSLEQSSTLPRGALSTRFNDEVVHIQQGSLIMPAIEADVRKFVSDNFLFGRKGVQLDADDSFLEQGLIDSTGVLELVSFIEDRFHVKVADDELVPDNLDSINRLIQFVEAKLEEAK